MERRKLRPETLGLGPGSSPDNEKPREEVIAQTV